MRQAPVFINILIVFLTPQISTFCSRRKIWFSQENEECLGNCFKKWLPRGGSISWVVCQNPSIWYSIFFTPGIMIHHVSQPFRDLNILAYLSARYWSASCQLGGSLCRSSRAGVVASGAISHENRHPPRRNNWMMSIIRIIRCAYTWKIRQRSIPRMVN